MANSKPAIHPHASKVLRMTRSGGERSSERPGKARAEATMEAMSHRGVNSPSTIQTNSHKDRTVATGSRIASRASSNRLCANAVAPAADGSGSRGTPWRNGSASCICSHPCEPGRLCAMGDVEFVENTFHVALHGELTGSRHDAALARSLPNRRRRHAHTGQTGRECLVQLPGMEVAPHARS